MLPFRATPAIPTMRTVVTSGTGLFPRPMVSSTTAGAALVMTNQRHNFFLPALQQRFASLGGGGPGQGFTSPSTPGGHAGKPRTGATSASRAMDEMIDADIDISDPPEAVGASHAATARAAREMKHGKGRMPEDDMEGNTMLYASAGALGLLGLYAVFKEPTTTSPSSSSSGSSSGSGGIKTRSTNELDPGTDARGRTSPLSSVKSSSRQHHDLPAHAPGGETIEFKLGRG